MKNKIQICNTIKPFNKILEIEGDKSLSIRWILIASQANGKSKSTNLLKSDDIINSLNIRIKPMIPLTNDHLKRQIARTTAGCLEHFTFMVHDG